MVLSKVQKNRRDNHTRVIFFCREYNDLDCRVPLINYLHKHENFTIEVVSIPTIRSSGLRVKHRFFKESHIDLTNIVHWFFNKNKQKTIRFFSRHFEQSKSKIIRFRLWPILWSLLFYKWYQTDQCRRHFKEKIANNIVIIDDILLDANRTFINQWLLSHEDIYLYCLAHGQNTYLNLWHDKTDTVKKPSQSKLNLAVYSPSENHSDYLKKNNEGLNLVNIGNTRFDKNWILFESKNIKDYRYRKNEKHSTKILFVMSKLEYGQNVEEVQNFINEVSSNPKIALCLKPHTRGMDISNLDIKKSSNLTIEYSVETSDLIDWADIVVFTGSSIIFEALIKQKKVIFLQCLQKYQTIFDTFPSNMIITKSDNILLKINNLIKDNTISNFDEFLNEHVYCDQEDGLVCKAFVDQHLNV